MEDGFAFQLSRVPWQFFGTLTFSRVPPEGKQKAMFFAFMRKVCKRHKRYFPRSIWCLRRETGEAFGRWHLHFLLGDTPGANIGECFHMMSQWRGGHSQIRVFNRQLAGVDYTLKGMDGADSYESARFGASELILSHGLIKKLRYGVKADSFATK